MVLVMQGDGFPSLQLFPIFFCREDFLQGVRASFDWTEGSPTKKGHKDTISDVAGSFELEGVTDWNLHFSLEKEGYYVSQRDTQFYFQFTLESGQPDPNNPAIFHLHKKGPGTELVTSQYGVKRTLGVQAAIDGTPVHVDPLTRRVGQSGPLEISQVKPNPAQWKNASEWTFRLAIPDGGFVEHNDEFPFEAPVSGYQPLIEFHFKKGVSNWTDMLRKQYYIAFGQPRKYGRIVIETSIELGGARLEYAINPDGSRYLEPK